MTEAELLKRLLRHFSIDGDGALVWAYIEQTAISDVDDKEFELELISFLDRNE